MKDNLTGVIVGALLVVVIILGVLHYQKKNAETEDTGGLYIGVTDASADISNVNDIDMSVKKVEVHSATKGWTIISSDSKKYQLLTLKASGDVKFYAKDEKVKAGIYDKVRVTVGETIVKTKTKGDMKATLPSSQVVMNMNVKVNSNENTHVKLDFLADKSLHTAADGSYVFAPVVKSESRSAATVTVSNDDKVSVSGGTVDADVTFGVDLDGSSKSNFQIASDASLTVGSMVGNTITFMLNGKTYTSDNSKDQEGQMDASVNTTGSMNSNGNSTGSVNINTSVNGNASGNTTAGSLNADIDLRGGVKVGN